MNLVAKLTMGTIAESIVRTDSLSTHDCLQAAREARLPRVFGRDAVERAGASGKHVVVRTGGSVTTRSMSEPGRIRSVAKEPNAFTCARGHSSVTTDFTLASASAWQAGAPSPLSSRR